MLIIIIVVSTSLNKQWS